MTDDTQYLRLPEAAKYLGGVSQQFLRRAHRMGTGPARTRAGGKIILYHRAELDRWLAARTETSGAVNS